MCYFEECDLIVDYDFLGMKNLIFYKCEKIKCECIFDCMFCGENGFVDISDFLVNLIKGFVKFECV